MVEGKERKGLNAESAGVGVGGGDSSRGSKGQRTTQTVGTPSLTSTSQSRPVSKNKRQATIGALTPASAVPATFGLSTMSLPRTERVALRSFTMHCSGSNNAIMMRRPRVCKLECTVKPRWQTHEWGGRMMVVAYRRTDVGYGDLLRDSRRRVPKTDQMFRNARGTSTISAVLVLGYRLLVVIYPCCQVRVRVRLNVPEPMCDISDQRQVEGKLLL